MRVKQLTKLIPFNLDRLFLTKMLKLDLFIAFLFSLLFSTGFLLFASKSSPLYPINDWVDPHAFFTVGKGMMNGLVPYRDLFEQKGPLLYFIYGIGYLISNTTFLGVFILEVIFFSVFLFFFYKILILYVNHQFALLTLPFIASSILNLRSFAHGGSAEQFSLTFIIISLYYLIRYAKRVYPKPMPYHWIGINGVLAGCILWIKYSFLGFWFGWIVTVTFCLLFDKHYQHAIKSCLVFLLGILTATMPWILYFGFHQSIGEWFNTYFVINLTAYPHDFSWREIFWITRQSLQRHLSFNPFSLSLMALGILIFVTHRKFLNSIVIRVGLLFSIGCLVLGVYIGGRDFIYYAFIFSPFILLGLIILANLYHQEYHDIKPKFLFPVMFLLVIFSTLFYTFRFNRNTYLLGKDREEFVQYRFAAVISESENPTLLNYNFPDGGFYTVTGILPSVRFFQSQNIDYAQFPLVLDEQNRYIQEKVVEFVVMRQQPSVDINNLPVPHLYENYSLIEKQNQFFGETEFTYLLYKRVNN